MIPFKDDDTARDELIDHVNALSLVVAVVAAVFVLVCGVCTPN